MADYHITEFNEQTGQIQVYYPVLGTTYAIDLPLDKDNNVPTGADLDSYIRGFIPTWIIERQEKLKAGIPNANEIISLLSLPTES